MFKIILTHIILFSFINLLLADVRIGVLNFVSQTGDKVRDAQLSEGTSDTIISYLGDVEGISVIERGQINKVIKEQQFSRSQLIDSNTAIKIGRLLSANYIVIGSWQKYGEKFGLNARLVEVETGKVIAPGSANGTINEIFDIQETVTKKIISKIGLSYGTIVRRTDSLKAFEQFSLAVKSYDDGDKNSAEKYAKESVKYDHNYQLPKKYMYYDTESLTGIKGFDYTPRAESEIGLRFQRAFLYGGIAFVIGGLMGYVDPENPSFSIGVGAMLGGILFIVSLLRPVEKKQVSNNYNFENKDQFAYNIDKNKNYYKINLISLYY